ncbi:MAG: prepilin-type N-terminal cleavage/methylation domain-containing protein [Puniceicoccaceae bacterium]
MQRGFTLIEIIIVIALIALVGALVAVNAESILRGLGGEPTERRLQVIIREARFQAASLKEPVNLRYDEESGILGAYSADGSLLASEALPKLSNDEFPEIEFEQILPAEGLDSFRMDTAPVQQVVFRPDRSSTPFQVTVDEGSASYTLRYDPFSAIVVEDSRI